ncbi:MAG: pantoate--beta-alanine ligase [Gammaproteobacteria bacterium]|jgi:pantoate--beta-alanine ligase|nr:MAG: pantoate--beta-alanine ligase [Gammaproteobacteria bacterium]
MKTVHTLDELRAEIRRWKGAGETIALAPTMGNLHDGHLSLLREARRLAKRTVVSIFVNPIQFGKGEDYEKYPSTLAEDQEKLAAEGLDLLFAPDLRQLYPAGMETDTRVTVPEISNILCGQFRPGHFSGVATVVSKLFINTMPDYALFGEKDYQQLLVIKRMVKDLCFPIEIIGMPIMRETDGLAMSSRNAYLDPVQRGKASLIYQLLKESAAKLAQSPDAILEIEVAALTRLSAAGFRPEYFTARRAADLAPHSPGDKQLILLTAAWLGGARLLDNLRVELQ